MTEFDRHAILIISGENKMKAKVLFKKIIWILLLTGILYTINRASKDSSFIYSWYASGVYPGIKGLMSIIPSRVNFSFGEVLVGIAVILGILISMYRFKKFIATVRVESIGTVMALIVNDVLSLITGVLVLVVVFQGIWGLNYHRPPLLEQLGLERQEVSGQVLESLLMDLSVKMDETRSRLTVSEDNVVMSQLSEEELFQQSYKDYLLASKHYKFVEPPASQPKPIAASLFFSYSGISGIFNPFTGEANVNTLNSAYMLPVVALHELAHQQGIAREDEANFIAYLISQNSQEAFTQYSGELLVLIHGLNNLIEIDPQAYERVYLNLSEGIQNDLVAHRILWATYDGTMEELQHEMNDRYLKANGQLSGVESYSEMIELYVAWTTK